MDNVVCSICGAGFRQVDGKGRCVSCAKAYPDANSLDELKAEKGGLKLFVTKEDVLKIVEERLADLLLMKTCRKCGAKFCANSPAQQTCHKCKTAETGE